MAGALSRRQQARNEKALQDLVHNVPGNNMCADCHTRNPGWASWSLGVFLCMRCAAIHRKLGTHVSKVKSLSMDSWSNEQVDNMRKVGNVASNQIYNSENKKPPVPIDADSADSAMERFIRQKYITNVARDSGKPKTPISDEGIPPPLPPKNSSKFGFRSASSIFPLSSRAKKEAKHAAAVQRAQHSYQPQPSSPGASNKPSQLFGATVDYDGPNDNDKLARLREMGFQDAQRNAIVLKGVNGNVDKAVEALVRLGEGDRQSPAPPPKPSAPERPLRTSRSMTPLTPGSGGLGIDFGASHGEQRAQPHPPATPSSTSTNPFDMMPPAQPQTAQSTGTLQNKNPYQSSLGAPAQQNDFFAQNFANMSLAPNSQAQPLFPHHTGGNAAGQAYNPPPQTQQQMPPSAPTSPHGMPGYQHGMTYPQPSAMQPQSTGWNPFAPAPASAAPQQAMQQNLSLNTGQTQGNLANNPFTRSPTSMASPTLGQIPEQMQPSFQNYGNMPMSPAGTNPFLASPMQSPIHMAQHPFGQPQYTQPQYMQPQRADKASIMALYGQTPATPQQSTPSHHFQPTQVGSIPENNAVQPHTPAASSPYAHQAPAGTQNPPTSNNPFINNGTGTGADQQASSNRNQSRESMNLGMDLAWTNGRHSPDAFASLSARH